MKDQEEIKKTRKEWDADECFEITGFHTYAEFYAYQKGKEDKEKFIMDYIEKWNGSGTSLIGCTILKRLYELENEKHDTQTII